MEATTPPSTHASTRSMVLHAGRETVIKAGAMHERTVVAQRWFLICKTIPEKICNVKYQKWIKI